MLLNQVILLPQKDTVNKEEKMKIFRRILKISILATLPGNCLKQFSRTVFWDSIALRLSYNCRNVDALGELGIIRSAWHFRTFSSSTPLCVKDHTDARLHS